MIFKNPLKTHFDVVEGFLTLFTGFIRNKMSSKKCCLKLEIIVILNAYVIKQNKVLSSVDYRG